MAEWHDDEDILKDLDYLSGITAENRKSKPLSSFGRGKVVKREEMRMPATTSIFQEDLRQQPQSPSGYKEIKWKWTASQEYEVTSQIRDVYEVENSNQLLENTFGHPYQQRDYYEKKCQVSKEETPKTSDDEASEYLDEVPCPKSCGNICDTPIGNVTSATFSDSIVDGKATNAVAGFNESVEDNAVESGSSTSSSKMNENTEIATSCDSSPDKRIKKKHKRRQFSNVIMDKLVQKHQAHVEEVKNHQDNWVGDDTPYSKQSLNFSEKEFPPL